MKVLICGYNDAETIKRTLESVKEYKVHFFDGRFKDFPGKEWSSTDGTLEIVQQYPNVKIHPALPDETQCEKRTRMFSVLKEGEYGLKLDADEVLLNPIKDDFKADVIWAWTISPIYDYPYCTARIFKKKEGMHYAGKHHFLFDKKNKLIASDQNQGTLYRHDTLPFRVFNARTHRTEQRDSDKRLFLIRREERKVHSEHHVYGKQHMTRHPERAQTTRRPMDTLYTAPEPSIKPYGPSYTYSILFSRQWAIKRYFDNLDKLILPPAECLCVVDSDNKEFYAQIQRELLKRKDKFTKIKTYLTEQPAPLEKRFVNQRRLRIARNLHIILTEAKGDILLGSEDDSLPQADAYAKLTHNLNKADFAQGTIVGRWEPTIPAWHVQEVSNKLFKIWTGEKKTGLEEIQGMGWYCFAVRTNVMRSVKIHWDYVSHIGPDFHMGYDLWKNGFKLVHDHDVKVIHFGEDWERTLEHETVVKHWIKNGRLWRSY